MSLQAKRVSCVSSGKAYESFAKLVKAQQIFYKLRWTNLNLANFMKFKDIFVAFGKAKQVKKIRNYITVTIGMSYSKQS